jgi:2-C-methyl-D-erythritol 4-phosphate cytidylyltransferase
MAVPRIFVVVPAAGTGTRYGEAVPKQYALLDGKPLLAHVLARLRTLHPVAMVVALAPDDHWWNDTMAGDVPVDVMRCGGATRAGTVRNALAALAPRCGADDFVAVHDAARACVPLDALGRLAAALENATVGGLLALPVSDTLKRSDAHTPAHSVRTEDRRALWLAQTPQVFRYAPLCAALDQPGAADCTDEAEAMERAGHRPLLVPGSSSNLKVTYAADLALAAAILAHEAQVAHPHGRPALTLPAA